MVSCSAFGCKNRTGRAAGSRGITFHRFPNRVKLHKKFKQWVWNLRWKNWTPSPNSVVCSNHFTPSCFNRTGCLVRLKPFAVPTIFSFPGSSCKIENDYLRPYKTRIRTSRRDGSSTENTETTDSKDTTTQDIVEQDTPTQDTPTQDTIKQDTPTQDKSESTANEICITKSPQPPCQPSSIKEVHFFSKEKTQKEQPAPNTSLSSKMFYKNQNGDHWMEFNLNSPVLSCVIPKINKPQIEESSTSNVPSSPVEASTSDTNLAANSDDDDPAALLATRKTSQLMKLLRKYRKKNRIPPDTSQTHLLSPRNINLEPESIYLDDRTQFPLQDNISHEETKTLSQDDPQVINIDGISYMSVFDNSDEDALVKYIVSEAMNRTKETLCQIVYNFCVIHNIARPASWNTNRSADIEWLNGFMRRHSDVFFENGPCQRKEQKPHKNTYIPIGKEFLIYLLPISTVDKTIGSPKVPNPAMDHNYAAICEETLSNT